MQGMDKVKNQKILMRSMPLYAWINLSKGRLYEIMLENKNVLKRLKNA